ncbi:MAG: hypothetical protein ABIJ97_05850 [Bacteroidota bacterium]
MKKTILLLLLGVLIIGSYAQKGVKVEFRLKLRDGNIMSGTSSIDKINLETNFGKLIIPIKNATSVELGIVENETKKADLLKKAKSLDSSSEEVREKTYQEIIDYGISAIPTLYNFIYSSEYVLTDNNTIYTAEGAYKELKALHNVGESMSFDDVVSIDYNYKIGGKSSISAISLKTEYGSLEIPREKIEKIDIMYLEEGDGSAKKFVLLATTHISGNTAGGWLSTGIAVKPGQKLNITATGEVTLASLSNGKYNPDGAVGTAPSSYDSTYPTYGNVVYKIGESGTLMKAGSKFNGIADSSGMLYISIYETVYNSANTGSYIVKVSVK